MSNASFYPDLRPSVYPELVRQVTEFARTCEARVNDGEHYVNRVKLRDSMHFAAESTEIVVQMYIERCCLSKAYAHILSPHLQSGDKGQDGPVSWC